MWTFCVVTALNAAYLQSHVHIWISQTKKDLIQICLTPAVHTHILEDKDALTAV